MNPNDASGLQRSQVRILVRRPKAKERSLRSSLSLLVGVTGFEPATSWTRSVKTLSNKDFLMILGVLESENNAFGCSRSHCVHVVRSGRWSKVWSTPLNHISTAPYKSRKLLPRWTFCCHHYSIKQRIWQVPS